MSGWISIGEYDIQTYTATEKEALAILNEGKNYFHIAYRLHVSFERAREIVFSIRKKESLIMGKLTNTQRAAIFQAWKDGTTPKELAKQYGVSVQSIYNMVNKLNKQPTQQLEDCENGIPNTPLVPAEIEKEISVIAEKKTENAEVNSTNAEPEKLPDVVWNAIDDQICALNLEIETREQRIAELHGEVAEYEAKKEQLMAWLEAHT